MHGANWKPTRRIAHGSFEAWMRFWYQWIQRRKRKRRPDEQEPADAEDDADNREREERETENSFLRANVKARRKTKTTMFSQQQ